jgi:hypothetical protein
MEETGFYVTVIPRSRPRFGVCAREYQFLILFQDCFDSDALLIVVSRGEEAPYVIWTDEHGFLPHRYPPWLRRILKQQLLSQEDPTGIEPFPVEGLLDDDYFNDEDEDSDDDWGNGDDDGSDIPPSTIVDALLDELSSL